MRDASSDVRRGGKMKIENQAGSSKVTAPWIKQIKEYNETFRNELKRRKMF
jgi:hypothetical protein